ncbi:PilW family protein [Salinisphaera orenii]|uniref:Pilus assembly protein PilW n=1 Tax=Salinisphaera orenii YIM 95161 TaxID=1051139 RepID=A0A423PIV8_9GAMM|nr:PilW family protein [Salinisphaera halophila]ROO25520.1 hypothetical protein SAHL_14345 [Salinisphaera halophila YIM 95161]
MSKGRPAATHPHHASGFSLVELMVALVVGLLLLAGVLQILLSNRQSFDAQRATAHVQENARLAAFVLEHSIAHAGYYVELDDSVDTIFPQKSGTPGYSTGAAIAAEADTHGDSDTLRLRFESAGGVRDCRGREVGTSGNPKDTDFEFYVNDDEALICRIVGGDAQPIVENVERFEVRYGLDTDGEDGVDRYVSELDGTLAGDVLSVRVQLLLRGAQDSPAYPAPVERTYVFSDGSERTFSDRIARLMVDQTIALKNRLP